MCVYALLYFWTRLSVRFGLVGLVWLACNSFFMLFCVCCWYTWVFVAFFIIIVIRRVRLFKQIYDFRFFRRFFYFILFYLLFSFIFIFCKRPYVYSMCMYMYIFHPKQMIINCCVVFFLFGKCKWYLYELCIFD